MLHFGVEDCRSSGWKIAALQLLRAYADLSAQPASYKTIERRIAEHGHDPSARFAADFHNFAERVFAVEDQAAWSPRLRSRSAALKTPKRHLADPSLAAALMRATADRLLRDRETLGFLFESLVVRDLRIYADANDWRGVYHYRDQKARDEIDAVIETDEGEWIGVEAKLNYDQAQAASENLLRVAAKIAAPPRELMVIVPSGRAFRADNGVWIVPLTALKP